MKNISFSKILSLLVMLALLAAMALTFTACAENEPETTELPEVSFTVEVTKADGTTKSFEVKTNKESLGDALLDEEMISGEDGPYGWYITTVDGEYHKYEEDGKYWAFYIDGEYAVTGVSQTEPTEGALYSFRAES
ncbi:MAG: DUF4430 domain-containing protein [Clostridia bacterium]|nr:DUF4430 domain-containing protein [Clostridia bacterium]